MSIERANLVWGVLCSLSHALVAVLLYRFQGEVCNWKWICLKHTAICVAMVCSALETLLSSAPPTCPDDVEAGVERGSKAFHTFAAAAMMQTVSSLWLAASAFLVPWLLVEKVALAFSVAMAVFSSLGPLLGRWTPAVWITAVTAPVVLFAGRSCAKADHLALVLCCQAAVVHFLRTRRLYLVSWTLLADAALWCLLPLSCSFSQPLLPFD